MPHYLWNNFAERRDARGDLRGDAARTLSILATDLRGCFLTANMAWEKIMLQFQNSTHYFWFTDVGKIIRFLSTNLLQISSFS